MAKECVSQEISQDELKDYDEAFLEKIDDKEISILALPSSCSSGHGWCESGKCYVCCSGTWYRFTDKNGNHYSCSQGRGKYYKCGTRNYLATC